VSRLLVLRHRLAEPARHGVESLVDGLVELRLPRAEDFRHRGHAAVHFRLRFQDLGHAGFCFLGTAPAISPVLFQSRGLTPRRYDREKHEYAGNRRRTGERLS
jgi:hypothetical protein